MDYDLAKIITLSFGAVGAAKLIYDFSIGKRNRMREEYKFAKDFLDEVSTNKKMHPYLLEKGYQAIAGDQQIGAQEIEYLLSLKGPERALRDYVLGRIYLEHLPDAGNLQINFRSKYQGGWPRWWRKILYGLQYLVLAFLAFSPLFLPKEVFKDPSQIFSSLIVSIVVFGPYAWFSVKAATKIYRAEKLVKNQAKHTQRIVLDRSNLTFERDCREAARVSPST